MAEPIKSMIVIPARLASSRLPGKLMLRETGRTLIEHTYRAACQAKLPSAVLVATDHQSIADEVAAFGGQAVMTNPDASSGTDRVAEVAEMFDDIDVFVNVQGDEPEIDANSIDSLVRLLQTNPDSSVATMATPIRQEESLYDPSCVKVVRDHLGRALYFSRSPIPYPRDGLNDLLQAAPPIYFQHLGLYGYRRDFLLTLSSLPQSRLESTESLEQLRFLNAGYTIEVGTVEHPVQGIDTAADYRAFVLRQAG